MAASVYWKVAWSSRGRLFKHSRRLHLQSLLQLSLRLLSHLPQLYYLYSLFPLTAEHPGCKRVLNTFSGNRIPDLSVCRRCSAIPPVWSLPQGYKLEMNLETVRCESRERLSEGFSADTRNIKTLFSSSWRRLRTYFEGGIYYTCRCGLPRSLFRVCSNILRRRNLLYIAVCQVVSFECQDRI